MIEIGAKFDNGWNFDGVCKKCGKNTSACICQKTKEIKEPSNHLLVITIEKRKNKKVTVAKEFFITEEKSKDLLKRLKKTLGRGGSFKNGVLEIQGETAERLRDLLEKEGYRVK